MEPNTEALLEAVRNPERVGGLTHQFYRYPARFSPLFARMVIKLLSQPGDVVLDPFMGGGTTLVEAFAAGRNAVGVDINGLAVFVARAKTTIWPESALSQVNEWCHSTVGRLRTTAAEPEADEWARLGYHRNIGDRSTWRIRRLLQLALAKVKELPRCLERSFARCVLLRTAQWALDCRAEIPNVTDFRKVLLLNAEEMMRGAREVATQVAQARRDHGLSGLKTLCLHRSAVDLETEHRVASLPAPTLILTSPPYPGVHVLYHRWQVRGRRETPAPFWITGSFDGNGESFYTFGDRKQQGLVRYYAEALAAFRSLARTASRKTLVVQMLAFSKASWQLPRYLAMMGQAGFKEAFPLGMLDSPDGRLWRDVPNRKWYAHGDLASGSEVVLFHRLVRETGEV